MNPPHLGFKVLMYDLYCPVNSRPMAPSCGVPFILPSSLSQSSRLSSCLHVAQKHRTPTIHLRAKSRFALTNVLPDIFIFSRSSFGGNHYYGTVHCRSATLFAPTGKHVVLHEALVVSPPECPSEAPRRERLGVNLELPEQALQRERHACSLARRVRSC